MTIYMLENGKKSINLSFSRFFSLFYLLDKEGGKFTSPHSRVSINFTNYHKINDFVCVCARLCVGKANFFI